MISIGVDSSMTAKFEAIKKQIRDTADKQFRQKALIMFRDLVTHSPQWSGNFASNWRMTMDSGYSGYTESVAKGMITDRKDARSMGDMDMIAGPLNYANTTKVDYRQPLYFINNTPLEFSEAAGGPEVTGEGVTHKVRPENLVAGQLCLKSYILAKYS